MRKINMSCDSQNNEQIRSCEYDVALQKSYIPFETQRKQKKKKDFNIDFNLTIY